MAMSVNRHQSSMLCLCLALETGPCDQAKTQFSYTILSKRKLAWFVDNGHVTSLEAGRSKGPEGSSIQYNVGVVGQALLFFLLGLDFLISIFAPHQNHE